MNIDPVTLGSLTLIGAGLSIFIQIIKKKFGGGSDTMAILVILSIILGIAYFILRQHQNLFQDIIGILVVANAIYNFILQWFEKPDPLTAPTDTQ